MSLSIARAILSRETTSSAAPISTAALGIPQTTLDDSSWAIVRQPLRRRFNRPTAPSRSIPVKRTPTPGLGQFRAALSKKTSTRRPVRAFLGLDGIMKTAIFAQHQVVVGAGEQDVAYDGQMSISG